MPVPPVPAIGARVLAELRWHRRSVAAGLLVAAFLLAVRPVVMPGEPTVRVLVAARDLAAGSPLAPADVRTLALPTAALPDGVLGAAAPVAGRVPALPVLRGEVLTEVRLLGTALLGALGPGTVAAPVRLADSAAVGVAQVGDLVDVLAAGEGGATGIAAAGARVLIAPTSPTEPVVVVAVTSAASRGLARAAATARLSLVIRGP